MTDRQNAPLDGIAHELGELHVGLANAMSALGKAERLNLMDAMVRNAIRAQGTFLVQSAGQVTAADKRALLGVVYEMERRLVEMQHYIDRLPDNAG